MTQVSVKSFGEWRLLVDGIVTRPLQSRLARELLTRLSLTDEPLSREQVIDELWPEEGEVTRGRRRLSQELNKVQAIVGSQVWFGARDSVGLHPNCALTSDLREFLSETDTGSRLTDQLRDHERLLRVLRLPRSGSFLPGHTSEWAEATRAAAKRHEIRMLRRALETLGDGASAEALILTRRLAELDPYDDATHGLILPLLAAQAGKEAAENYFAEVDQRYRSELGSPLDPLLREAVTKPPLVAKDQLGVTTQRLKDDIRRLSSSGAANDEIAAVLAEVDDHLRIAGNIGKRQEVVAQLVDVGGATPDTARRLAEIALASCDVGTVERILDEQGNPDPGIESTAWLSLLEGHVCEVRGSYDSAMSLAKATTEAAVSSEAKIEAFLLVSRLAAAMPEIHEAEQAALRALSLADGIASPYYRAAAQVRLAWIRVRVGDYLSSEQYLNDSLTTARRIGARAIEAEALGVQAYYCSQSYRYGSSLELARAAATISMEIGDSRSEMRWRLNACLMAFDIGDIESLVRELDTVVSKFNQYEVQATAVNLEIVEANLLWLQRDYEVWIARLAETAQRMSAENVHYGASLAYAAMPRGYIELGRSTDAVRAAHSAVAYTEQHHMPMHVQALARAALGAALTASGESAAGIVHLREVMSVSQGQVTAAHVYLPWLHAAATELDLVDEAEAAEASAAELIRKIRSDLTNDQWKIATTNSIEMQLLAAVADSGEKRKR